MKAGFQRRDSDLRQPLPAGYVQSMQTQEPSPASPDKPWLPFRLVYLVLVLNFAIPALFYLFLPNFAVDRFEEVGRTLGDGLYPMRAGELGFMWRVLAAGNVMTLAFMCGLILWDVRKYYIVLVPLVFLKGFSALAYLGVFLIALPYRGFLALFALDSVTAIAMVVFARRAYQLLSR